VLQENDASRIDVAILDPTFRGGAGAQALLLSVAGLEPPPDMGLPVTYLTGAGRADWQIGTRASGRVIPVEKKHHGYINFRKDGVCQLDGYVEEQRTFLSAEFLFVTPDGHGVLEYAGTDGPYIRHADQWRPAGHRDFIRDLEEVRRHLPEPEQTRMTYLMAEAGLAYRDWSQDCEIDPRWRQAYRWYRGHHYAALQAEVALLAGQRDWLGLHDEEVAGCATSGWEYSSSRVGLRSSWVRHRFVHDSGLILRIGVPHSPSFDDSTAKSGWVYILKEETPLWAKHSPASLPGGCPAVDEANDWGFPFYRYGRFDPLGAGDTLAEAYGSALRHTTATVLSQLDHLMRS
jgi:hypothetical protein